MRKSLSPRQIFERPRFRRGMSIIDRFWDQVDKTGDCWLWTTVKSCDGYGKFRARPEMWLAHRFAYFITHGDFDRHLYVLHHCDNPPCVNPKHLFLGTQLDNMRDCVKKGRLTRTILSHCRRGHSKSGENVRYYRGYAVCKCCHNDARRRRKNAAKNIQPI